MIDEYKAAGVAPEQVFAQSFNLADVKYWLAHEPAFGAQAVFLDGRDETSGARPDARGDLAAVDGGAEGTRASTSWRRRSGTC